MNNRFPPWWTYLAFIPIIGWFLLPIAGMLFDWRGITGRLAYRHKWGKWETPAEGRITFIDRQGNKVCMYEAAGYVKDGVTTWYPYQMSVKDHEMETAARQEAKRVLAAHFAEKERVKYDEWLKERGLLYGVKE